MSKTSHKIGMWQGAALLATTLLGTSVFILPQMTINIAANGALLAWILLTLAIIPVAVVFGKLAGQFPHSAGPAYFVEQAFGVVAGRTIGMIFLLVVPLGAPAAILMTFQFVDSLVQLSPVFKWLMQLGLLLLIALLNYRGIQISAKLQLGLTLSIVAVVVLLFGQSAALSEMKWLPVGPSEQSYQLDWVLVAAGLAFWSFLGVEAITHLANDFENPKRDLVPALLIGCVLVGLIYLACTYLQLLYPSQHGLAMVQVFDRLMGGYGAQVIGILGIAGGIATVNVYTASLARLAWSFSNDGVLPRYFQKRNTHQVPVRALNLLLGIMGIVITITFLTAAHLEDLIAWVNGVFVMIYFASMLAALKLLQAKHWLSIFFGSVFCLALMWGLGHNMLYALFLIAVTSPLLYWQHQNQMTNSPATAPNP